MTKRIGPDAASGVSLDPRAAVADWSTLGGRTFAAITVTESVNWTDTTAARHLTDALRAGVHAGIRHRARPGGAPDQARHLVRAGMSLGAFAPGALAPTLDARAEGVDDRFVKTWIKTLRQVAMIRKVLVFATSEQWSHRFRPDKWVDDDVVLWLSRHNGIPGRPGWFHARLGVHEHADGHGVGRHAFVYPFTLADVLL